MKPAQPASSEDPRRIVERILLSPLFHGEEEISEILLYICYYTQSGNLDALREHDIGVAVLGLEPGYDVRENTAVADAVDKIRERLKLYFANEGRREPMRLTIPKGEFRAFFYEADPRELAAADGPTAVERFWAPYWRSKNSNLLVHGELPGDLLPIAEAYAATRIAVLFAEHGSGLQMRPASSVTNADLKANLILIGLPATNRVLKAFLMEIGEDPVIERLAPNAETPHGVITALTAPTPEGLLQAAEFTATEELLAEHEYPSMFRLRLYPKP